MAGRYKGYFNGLNGTNYRVEFEKSGSTGEFVEIKLSGDNPFSVQYNESKTPFDPVRTSTASINIVHNNYLEDILSPYAQGTKVTLYSYIGNTDTVEWVGYLTPQVYDQGYTMEYETITLEAADCVSSLQYLTYETIENGVTKIVTFADAIAEICNRTNCLIGYYWTRSKKVGNTIVLPSHLKLSEHNLYTNDEEEYWKLKELLEEICKFVGMTCFQWQNKLYFIDYQYFEHNDDIYATYFPKSNNYAAGSSTHLGGLLEITKNTYRGSSNDITFLPIYNKAKVNCNNNIVEDFAPSIFEDAKLTNRINPNNFLEKYEVKPENPVNPSYPWGGWLLSGQKYSTEGTLDSDYKFFHRLYDHRDWESVYYNSAGTRVYPSTAIQSTSSITRDYMGATLLDLGVVKKDYFDEEHWQYITPSKLDYTRYLCISQKGYGVFAGTDPDKPLYRLKNGFKLPIQIGDGYYLIINYTMLFEKYKNRAYINPEWTTDTIEGGGANYSQAKTGGQLYFRLGIGNLFWNGTNWAQETNRKRYFGIPVERTDDSYGHVQTDVHVLNNVSWQLYVDEEGYKIPLSGVNVNDVITFELLPPSIQFVLNGSYEWNQYCWVKELTIKCVHAGQEGYYQASEKQDADVIYENDIDADAINELDEIGLKFSSLSDYTKPSYSDVGYGTGSTSTPLTAITEENISGLPHRPEENIVEKYVRQYQTPTKQFSLELSMDATPFSKIKNVVSGATLEKYVVLGQDIDYRNSRQTITMIEKKK